MIRTVAGDHQGEEDREIGVRAERLEGLLGAVGGGGQAVGAQSHPGQEGGERDAVEDPRIHRIPGLPDEDGLDCGGQLVALGRADYVFGVRSSQTTVYRLW